MHLFITLPYTLCIISLMSNICTCTEATNFTGSTPTSATETTNVYASQPTAVAPTESTFVSPVGPAADPETDSADLPPWVTHPAKTARRFLYKTINAIERALDFFGGETSEFNFDAAMGIRMLEGQVEATLKGIERGEYGNVDVGVIAHLLHIKSEARTIADASVPYIKPRTEDWEESKRLLLPGLWNHLDFPSRVTNFSHIIPPKYWEDGVAYNNSDLCLNELLGGNCKVSARCKYDMTVPGATHYDVTHQVLWIIVGVAAGCFKQWDYEKELQLFCANMLIETKSIAEWAIEWGGYDDYHKDLFMEQQDHCGMAGFRDFFRFEWLAQILEWQRPEGCWGNGEMEEKGTNKRVKREEKTLRAGCQSHVSSVALSTLHNYIRRLLLYSVYKHPQSFSM